MFVVEHTQSLTDFRGKGKPKRWTGSIRLVKRKSSPKTVRPGQFFSLQRPTMKWRERHNFPATWQ